MDSYYSYTICLKCNIWRKIAKQNNNHTLQIVKSGTPNSKPSLSCVSFRRLQNRHIHTCANHDIKLLVAPISITSDHLCVFWQCQYSLQDSLTGSFLVFKMNGLVIPRRGPRLCVEVYRGLQLLNWIYLATSSSPRRVWFPAGNVCLWKPQWGNSFFTLAQENEFKIVWRWDWSPGGGPHHLMSLGTNQKDSRGCIPAQSLPWFHKSLF